ncbi:ATP-binding cassette domain-containing protein [Conexibacter arvalis]|uniref:Ribose transport system ATP-binding protein n=1 Tax=Conexibacter arvalis TaxID=912552 RepID=A0A840IDU4_9ACTN|nr:ATP-binding cassette domain-containing protein [Conexibacter arvalis]MBB4662421.1 ribose transport system ATP-binding protein [Conexibacter arvalis]
MTALLALVFGALEPGFLDPDNLLDIGQQSAVIAIVAFAMTAVIVARGIDISVGGIVAAAGMLAGTAYDAGVPQLLCIAVAVLGGAGIGALNGALIGFAGISPFMATLATMAFARGLTLSISGGNSVAIEPGPLTWLGSATVGPVPVSLLVALLCLAVWAWVFGRTLYGRWLYAVGGNAAAARASLIPVRTVQWSTYVLTGASAGLGAVLTIGRVSSAQPLAGNGLEFTVITAVIVGGTKLMGGEGSVVGTAIGSLLLGVVATGLSFMEVSQDLVFVITGLLILVAVLANQRAAAIAAARRTLRRLRARARPHGAAPAGGARSGDDAGAATGAQRSQAQAGGRELRLEEVGKSFPGVRALDGVSFSVRSGEVVALMGENGAGKSTLVKTLGGVHEPDDGRMLLDGAPLRLRSAADAQAAGIRVIHQHFSLAPDLTAAENLFLGAEPTWGPLPLVRRRAMHARARRLFDDLGLDVRPGDRVETLSVGQRQMIEVAKAMLSEAWLVVMDEPTSALSNRERDRLYALIERLLGRGVGILYISHKMEEIFTLAQRVVVLRDGRFVGERAIEEVDERRLIELMVGRDVDNVFPHVAVEPGEELLRVDRVGDGGLLREASLRVRAGEVVALAGLMGSGRSEVLRCVAGLDRPASGSIAVAGRPLPPGRPAAASAAGVAYVPEDRHAEGFVGAMSIRDNVALAWLRRHSRRGTVPRRAVTELAGETIERLGVRPPDPARRVDVLSGGNQQKVVLGKWLATAPRVLLLDEPTRGVDVGAKAEIHQAVAELKRRGVAILMVSSELPEVLAVADRIVVMHEGRAAGELPRGASENDVMALAFGQGAAAATAVAAAGEEGSA